MGTVGITGVRSVHPEYEEHEELWERCEDVAEGGTGKLREKCKEYLPRYYEEEEEAYKARVKRTLLTNFTWRTIVGYIGLLQRKPAVITVPKASEPMLEDVTLSGTPIRMLIREALEEVLITGRAGLWVNYPDAAAMGATTAADAQRMGLRPSITMYDADDIDNWAERMVGNAKVLSMVKIKGERKVQVDEFTFKEETVYKVLDLVDMPDGSLVYRTRDMMYDSEKEVDVTLATSIPLMGGKPLDYIPFYFLGPDDTEPCVSMPPFMDLVDLNLTHWEMTSMMLNGCYYSGIPQAWISGYTPAETEKLRLGGTAWIFPAVGAKANLLEVGNAGFPALEKILDRLEHQAVVIGTRALEVQKPGGTEAVSTAMVHLAAEHSMLDSMGQAVSDGFTKAMKVYVAWLGLDNSDTKVMLNSDYFNTPLTAAERDSIVKGWQAGAISDEAKFDRLKQGGDFSPEVTFEMEQQRIAESTGLESTKQPTVVAAP